MPFEPYVGQIMPCGFNFPPRGWAFCDGSLLAISQNTALFSLLGTRFGGDGKVTFALPDLRGRAILGAASGDFVGEERGTTTVTLTITEMAVHSHILGASDVTGIGQHAPAAGRVFGVNTVIGGETIFGPTGTAEVPLAPNTNVTAAVPPGGNQPHNNMQPYLAINYVIALQGIYPSRD